MKFDIRRRIIAGAGSGGSFALPTFSGSHAIFGDEKQGYIECYSTGVLTIPKDGVIDVFILGSGLRGATGTAEGTGDTSSGMGRATGGKGGNGAESKNVFGLKVAKGNYDITVGAACSSTSKANASTAFGTTANSVKSNGGRGGYAYAVWGGGDDSNNTSTSGSKGSNGTSIPFAESTLPETVVSGAMWFNKQLGAGGGGGGGRAAGWKYAGGYAGGTYGGGNGGKYSGGSHADCTPGAANTGSGGGGGGAAAYGGEDEYRSHIYTWQGEVGGSGIVIVRWGFAA